MTGKTAAPTGRISKIDSVIKLMQQNDGATLDELVASTGWQPHSARAVLTGLRKKGHTITRTRLDGVSRYAIQPGEAR